jgi:hypothetical protein
MSDKVTVTLEVEVNPDWIEFVTHYPDIFMTDHCGYWMYGMEQEDELGWLVHEHDEMHSVREIADHPEYPAIVKAWREGKELPDNWFRLNKETAIKAWAEGVKRYGMDWYETGDAITYDVVLQMAILGEVRYG